MTDKHDKEAALPTISMQTVGYPDGSFGVSLHVTGLPSQQQADAALAHMQRMFCGDEIQAQ